MTEYGRASGSEPWDPDDPLYGDQGWTRGYDTANGGEAGGAAWSGQQQSYEGYYQQAPQTGGWDAPASYDPLNPLDTTGGYPTTGYQTGGYPTGGYDTVTGYDVPGGYDTGQGQYQTGGYAPDPYAQQPAPPVHPQHPQHPQHPGHPQGHPQGHPAPGYAGQGAPYQQQARPQAPMRPQAPHPAATPAPMPTPGAGPGPDPETGWDPGPDQGESDFFSRRAADDEDDDAAWSPADRRGDRDRDRGPARPKRRRGAVGCLVLALVLVGGASAAGLYGYRVYQDRFGPAPDFAGEGTGQIEIEIPAGATSSDIGNLLKEAGVVQSHDAFIEAASDDEEAARSIQPGVYNLRREMSAASALSMLTDPAALNVLTIPEGRRATEIYAAVDEELGEPEGTTEEAAGTADLGLPQWSEGEIEGFLFPSRYDVGGDTTPEELLAAMVERGEEEFTDIDLETQAAAVGQTPRDILTIASLIQAEAQEAEDFGRVSRVIYNRLDQGMNLEFDSTINYAMGRSTLDTSIEDTQFDSPYNTYLHAGLPPGPIGNPGHQAIEAALSPAEGPWLYFVTVAEGDTRFTDDFDEHQQNVDDFNAIQEGDG